jgi:hypothetical protein
MTNIITHRGLDPSKSNYFFESSFEAFLDQLSRRYGLEFDPQKTLDEIVVLHDSNLKRISGGKDERLVKNVSAKELLGLDLGGCRLATLKELLGYIQEKSSPDALSAIHLKNGFQADTKNLDALLRELENIDSGKFIIFDITLETAEYLKAGNPALHLAPSVSHPYDIERYQSAVGGTLFSVEQVLARKDLFDWVWLDEWDLSDKNGGEKKLCTEETFSLFREAGIKIGLVTPELHGTSPGLLGGEAHPDARDQTALHKRFAEILALKPDAVCTDYPDLMREMAGKI